MKKFKSFYWLKSVEYTIGEFDTQDEAKLSAENYYLNQAVHHNKNEAKNAIADFRNRPDFMSVYYDK